MILLRPLQSQRIWEESRTDGFRLWAQILALVGASLDWYRGLLELSCMVEVDESRMTVGFSVH